MWSARSNNGSEFETRTHATHIKSMDLPKEFTAKNIGIIANGCFYVRGRNIEEIKRFKQAGGPGDSRSHLTFLSRMAKSKS